MCATLRFLRSGGLVLGLAIVGGHLPAMAGEGLNLRDSSAAWPRWQTRLSLNDGAVVRSGLAGGVPLTTTARAELMNDYDLGNFGLALPHTTGRFRATGGLLFSLRAPTSGLSLASSLTNQTGGGDPAAPYFGLGFSGSLHKTGLRFSADVGLTADYPGGTWRFGRALFGNQGLDAAFRELRLQPRLQLGMQYSY